MWIEAGQPETREYISPDRQVAQSVPLPYCNYCQWSPKVKTDSLCEIAICWWLKFSTTDSGSERQRYIVQAQILIPMEDCVTSTIQRSKVPTNSSKVPTSICSNSMSSLITFNSDLISKAYFNV